MAWFFWWTANFWSTTLISSGNSDTFIVKVSQIWANLRAIKWWGTNYDYLPWIATDNLLNVYVAWYFAWTANFWSTTLIGSGGYDPFVAKLPAIQSIFTINNDDIYVDSTWVTLNIDCPVDAWWEMQISYGNSTWSYYSPWRSN
jgi:hypothetical protein